MTVTLSVVVPTFNAVDVIDRCLRSLIPAAQAGVEVIVVDDGSTDATVERVRSWSQYPVVLEVQQNAGPCVARNRGLALAKGHYVAFLDSDDEVGLEWHRFFLGLADAPDSTGYASCGMVVRDHTASSMTRSPEQMGAAYSALTALFLPGAYAVSRNLLLEVDGFVPGLPYGEHHELALRLAPRLSGGLNLISNDPLVVKHHDRSQKRVRAYDRARLTGSEYVLHRHRQALQRDRKMRADYHAVAGYAAYSLGDRGAAVRHIGSAVRSQPLRPKHWGRLLRVSVGRP